MNGEPEGSLTVAAAAALLGGDPAPEADAAWEGDTSAPPSGGMSVDEAAAKFAAMGMPDDETGGGEADGADEIAEGEDPDQQDATTPPPLYKLRVGDADVEVPADELATLYAQKGDLEHRGKALSTEHIETARVRARNIALLERLERSLQEPDSEDPVDWAWLRRVDPGEYQARITDRQVREEQAKNVAKERERLEAERGMSEAKLLFEAMPHWRDPAKAAAEGGKMRAYAEAVGLNEADLARLGYDHRWARVLRDAAVGREAAKAANDPKPAPKPAAAARPPQSGVSRDLAEYRQLSAKGALTQDEAARLILLGDKLPTDVWVKERNAQKSRQGGRR